MILGLVLGTISIIGCVVGGAIFGAAMERTFGTPEQKPPAQLPAPIVTPVPYREPDENGEDASSNVGLVLSEFAFKPKCSKCLGSAVTDAGKHPKYVKPKDCMPEHIAWNCIYCGYHNTMRCSS